jgi:hypothetical protein
MTPITTPPDDRHRHFDTPARALAVIAILPLHAVQRARSCRPHFSIPAARGTSCCPRDAVAAAYRPIPDSQARNLPHRVRARARA